MREALASLAVSAPDPSPFAATSSPALAWSARACGSFACCSLMRATVRRDHQRSECARDERCPSGRSFLRSEGHRQPTWCWGA
ncbi:hypothetical protein ACFPRL_22105 [Pseudoclavibacter helvolus]